MSIALWCVLIAAFIPILTTGMAKVGARYDNSRPRDSCDQLDGWRKRAYAAHLNAFEAFPFFAAAVIVASTQGGAGATLDGLALAWIAARLAYLACYIGNWPTARSVVWTVALAIATAIFTLPASN